jgi:hypothetical protein
VNRIIADASTSRGALPLVAYVLEALFARREGLTLTASAYEDVGGVGGALAKSADAIVGGLDDDGQARARKLLLRLVKIGRGSEDTVQSASREATLGAAGGGPQAELVLARLSGGAHGGLWQRAGDISGRLVVVSGDAGSERVDLVHEALIQRWDTLRAWLKNEREALELRDDVERAARVWEASGQDEGLLPKGAALARFLGVDRAALQEGATRYLRAAEEAARRTERERERSQRRLIGALVALVLGLFLFTARAIFFARDLEASKRAQIRQANMNMAAMVAGTVLSQLRAFGDAVERVASDEEVGRALQIGDLTKLQSLIEATYAFYDDPSHGLKHNGISPFHTWAILDKDGIAQAVYGKWEWSSLRGRDYPWRDYFKGAKRAAGKGLRSIYVSRAFKSEPDGHFDFAISAPIYGDDKRPVGVIVTTVASDANLGSLKLDDTQGIAVLVTPRDRERRDPKPESSYLIFRHPAIRYGEGIGIDNEHVRWVSEAYVASEESVARPLWPSGPDRVIWSDHYEDPVAETHPEYKGRWLAGFAPVGHTGFVVIVQTPETEAVTSERYLFRQLALWAGIAGVPLALFLLFTTLHNRRRRSAHAPAARRT